MAEKSSSETQEQELDYCTSSSDDSDVMIDGLDLCEEVLEEEGVAELILVSRKRTVTQVCEDIIHQPTEEVLGGQGYADFFRKCVSSLKKEKVIQRSPKGQRVRGLLDHLESGMPEDDVAEVATMLLPRLNKCIVLGGRYKLPSSAQAAIWTAFHQLRQDKQILRSWNEFIAKKVPQPYQQEPLLALQLLLDRILKTFIQNKAKGQRHSPSASSSGICRPLTAIESNAVRYMAGYVAVSLLKRYKKPTKQAQLKSKWNYFVRVLKGMKATDQPEVTVDSVLDYTRVWSDLIDRGGLYHINDNVFRLIEAIEMVVRQHLNVPNIQSYQPDTDLRAGILKDALESQSVLSYWETVADIIPARYEKYSLELLRVVIELWITIRGHSFAKEWTMKFERKYKKGTRKALREIQDNNN